VSVKYTADDLFRIARDHLSDVERHEFTFLSINSAFRQGVTEGPDVIFETDELKAFERRLLDKLETIRRIGFRGGRG